MFMHRLVSMTAIENFHQPRRGVKNSEAVCIIPVTHASLTLWAASDRKSTRLNSSHTAIYTFPYTTLFRPMTAIENFHQPRRGVKNSEAVCIIPVTHASLTLWAASTPALVAPQLHRITRVSPHTEQPAHRPLPSLH